MTEQEALEAFFAEWDRQANEYGASLTREQRDCAEEAWNAALAWLRSQGEPVAVTTQSNIAAMRNGAERGIFARDPVFAAMAPRETDVPLFLAPQPAIPDGWQPIETAPKDGTYVLVSNGRGVWVARFKAVYRRGWKPACPWQSMMLNHDHIPSTQRKGHPKHWMPLPAGPGTEQMNKET